MTVCAKKYRWRVVWFLVWVVAAIVAISTAFLHLYTGASTWRLLFDVLYVTLFTSNVVDHWNRLQKMRKQAPLK